MKSKSIYLLKGTLYRDKAKHSNLIEIHEEFYDENLIVARMKAFCKYQSYIEVLLESRNIAAVSHEQSGHHMQYFIDSGKKQLMLNNPDLEIDTDFDKGLFLYFIPNADKKIYTKENQIYYTEKYLVHFMDNNKVNLWKHVLDFLILEYKFYIKHNFSIGNNVIITWKKDLNGKMQNILILRTPLTDMSDIL